MKSRKDGAAQAEGAPVEQQQLQDAYRSPPPAEVEEEDA